MIICELGINMSVLFALACDSERDGVGVFSCCVCGDAGQVTGVRLVHVRKSDHTHHVNLVTAYHSLVKLKCLIRKQANKSVKKERNSCKRVALKNDP